MGPYHPESPQRLIAIKQALTAAPWANQLTWFEAASATKDQLLTVHTKAYVESLFSMKPNKYLSLDPDTMMNPFTLSAALHAAGALIGAVKEAYEGKHQKAFCAIRPPGHHAEPDAAMGFCFFNNVAIGVRHAIDHYDCQRVAIVDFDVHHGNGTESMFKDEPKVCFWSSFQHPFYPGAKVPSRSSFVHLSPLSAGADSTTFRKIVDNELIPLLESFQPECIFISAGFDAHHLDPLANINLTSQDYGYVTEKICQIAHKTAQGRVISTLEGGYHLKAIAESVIEHVNAMINCQIS